MTFTFDGVNKLIILDAGTTSFTAQEIYSRWKDWMLLSDNSKFEIAFTSVAGDPISATQTISAYIFLNTTAGWRIRPQESNHYLTITGNLYSVDPDLQMFVPTLGNYTVTVQIDRSAASITTTVGASGIDEATIQSAMTAQGYTPARSVKLDKIDIINDEVDQIKASFILASGLVTATSSSEVINTDITGQYVQSYANMSVVVINSTGERCARVIRSHSTSGAIRLAFPLRFVPSVGSIVYITSQWMQFRASVG